MYVKVKRVDTPTGEFFLATTKESQAEQKITMTSKYRQNDYNVII